MSAVLVEVADWSGSMLVLAAYALPSTDRLAAASRTYQAMNILGALGMAMIGWWHGALPSVFNNGVWMAIGVVAVARLTGSREAVAKRDSSRMTRVRDRSGHP